MGVVRRKRDRRHEKPLAVATASEHATDCVLAWLRARVPEEIAPVRQELELHRV